MKKLFFSLFFLFTIPLTYSQNIKIIAGSGLTKVQSSKPIKPFNNNISVLSLALGFDFLENEKYYLSNEIGFLQIGGKETSLEAPFPDYLEYEKKWNYLFVSSAFRYKLPSMKEQYYYFLGAGPKISFSMSSEGFQNTLYEDGYDLKSVIFGVNLEIGFIRKWERYNAGIIVSYLLNVSPIAKSNANNLNSYPIYLNLSLGYVL